MASLGTAVLELVTDGEKLKKGLQDAGGVAREWGGKMIQVGGDIANGLRPLTGVVEDIAKRSVDLASATEESLNKVQVVFGSSAPIIEAWAKDSAKNLGIGRQAALEAAGTFGNLFTAMGLGRPEAAGLSKNIVELAADLASFNNIKPEEALEKLRAGLVGEAEPLRTLGVNLTEASVKAYAMAHGIGDAKGNMTDAEKITARYGLIVEQTANAHGDFARTSDGLANSLRIQKAEQENVEAELGKALIPVMKTLTSVLTGVLTALATMPEPVRNIIIGVGLLVVAIGPLLTIFGVLVTGIGLFIGVALPAEGSFLAMTVAAGGLEIALGPLILVIGAIALAVLLLKIAWDNNWGDIQGRTKVALDFWMNAFDGVRLFLLTVWRAILEGIGNAVNGVIGIINGFIGKYNELATKLGLPLLPEIRLLTPNLAAVDAQIDQITRDRVARIQVNVYEQAIAGGGGTRMFAEGTDHVTTGPESFVAGERGPERVTVTPLSGGRGRASETIDAGGHGHDVIMDGQVVATLIGRRYVRGAAGAGGAIG